MISLVRPLPCLPIRPSGQGCRLAGRDRKLEVALACAMVSTAWPASFYLISIRLAACSAMLSRVAIFVASCMLMFMQGQPRFHTIMPRAGKFEFHANMESFPAVSITGCKPWRTGRVTSTAAFTYVHCIRDHGNPWSGFLPAIVPRLSKGVLQASIRLATATSRCRQRSPNEAPGRAIVCSSQKVDCAATDGNLQEKAYREARTRVPLHGCSRK